MAIERQYGEATTINFPLVDAGAQDFEATPVTHAAGDTQISKDEAAFGNTSNAFAHEGNGTYSIALTATEMQAARIVVTIIDQTATKEWEDQAVIIETKGHPSAQHPNEGIPLPDSGLVTGTPTSTTAALGGNLPATDDIVNGTAIYFSAGTGSGQTRQIVDYDTGTDTVTVDPAWTTTPDTTTVYHLLPAAPSPTATANLTPVDAKLIEGVDATDQIRDAIVSDATRFAGADIAAILTDTAEIGAAGAGLTEAGGTGDQFTAVPWNAAWDAEVQSEVNDGLVAYDAATGADVTALNDPTAVEIRTEIDNNSTQVAAIKTVTDNLGAAAATKLAQTMAGAIAGAAATGTLSTTQATTDLTGFADDQLIGRTIVVTSGAAQGEATEITDSALTNGLLTFNALTTAMANGDTFVIV